MKTIKYKVLVEVPENWIDPNSPTMLFSWAVEQEFKRQVQNLVDKQLILKLIRCGTELVILINVYLMFGCISLN